MVQWITYKVSEGTINVTEKGNKVVFNYPCGDSNECYPYEVDLIAGHYFIEVWGSQGGDARKANSKEDPVPNTGGRGAFVSGIIELRTPQKFYFYVGSKGEDQWSTSYLVTSKGGFNGGADGGRDLNDNDPPESSAGGGGSSDIRLIKDKGENTIESLQSRIIVAGAGGGASSVYDDPNVQCEYTTSVEEGEDLLCKEKNEAISNSPYGGAAGALYGYKTNTVTYPGNQTKGYFGSGMTGASLDSSQSKYGGSIGGGGSGYFGGTYSAEFSINLGITVGGAGSSSYVSGCEGCRSIIKDSQMNETTDNPIHYSGLSFTSIRMYSGIEGFKSPEGKYELGHSGHGPISITFIVRRALTCEYRPNLLHRTLYTSSTFFLPLLSKK